MNTEEPKESFFDRNYLRVITVHKIKLEYDANVCIIIFLLQIRLSNGCVTVSKPIWTLPRKLGSIYGYPGSMEPPEVK